MSKRVNNKKGPKGQHHASTTRAKSANWGRYKYMRLLQRGIKHNQPAPFMLKLSGVASAVKNAITGGGK